jgi:hypothetical protein
MVADSSFFAQGAECAICWYQWSGEGTLASPWWGYIGEYWWIFDKAYLRRPSWGNSPILTQPMPIARKTRRANTIFLDLHLTGL